VLDATNERRIEHLQGIAARRIGQRGLSRGWSAWRDAWEERRRQRQTLASSGARLLRPKLAASFGGWRHEWEVSQAADEVRAHEILLSRQVELRDSLELQLAAVQAELEAANKAVEEEHNAMKRRFLADALLKEEAAATQLALSLEEEREKRVNHLQRVAARRIGQQGLSRGWTAWQELYDEQVAQRQMLASAGARLLRPKLAASFVGWRWNWEAERERDRLKAAEVLAFGGARHRDGVEREAERLRAELDAARRDAQRALEAAHNEFASEMEAMRQAMRAQELSQHEAAAKALMEKLEEERGRRVDHLQRVAARRIGQQGLSR
jgi:hypothetical protein